MTTETRQCKYCQLTKNLTTDFYPNNSGYKNLCKICDNKRNGERQKLKRQQKIKTTIYERTYNELSDEIKQLLKKEITEYKTPLRVIQRKYNYPYTHLIKWNSQFISPVC